MPRRRRTIARTCVWCSKQFQARPYDVQRGYGLFCSRACKGTHELSRLNFERPDATRREMVNAHGLVNGRRRAGKLERPDACQACERECKPDAHHPDYDKPSEVWWLCRSCHMRLHYGTLPQDLMSRLEAVA